MLRIEALTVELTDSGCEVVCDIDLEIAAGEIVALVGESGSGKTTVGTAVLGHTRSGARIVSGAVYVDDENMLGVPRARLRDRRGSVVSYVPQDPTTFLNPYHRVGRQLAELFEFHEPNASQDDVRKRIAATCERVDLQATPDLLRRYPHQLSGGQQQRVVIAMAALLHPKVIVFDEPTTGLDVTTQAAVLATIAELCDRDAVAGLYITHDLAVVANLAHRVAVMYAGRIVEAGVVGDLFGAPAHPYTRSLVGAIPSINEKRPLSAIRGKPPSPCERPHGCAFGPRCDHAVPACHEASPGVFSVGDNHSARCIRLGKLGSVSPIAVSDTPPRVTDTQPVLAVSGLDAWYGRVQALRGVSLELQSGECLAVVGTSGCGKTTLARCIVGLHSPHAGHVTIRGETLQPRVQARSRACRRSLQYVFQNPYGSLNPRRMVGDILRVPLDLYHDLNRAQTRERIEGLLERVGLPANLQRQRPAGLSGGERQRVAIARALACEPEILICDEVTSALDVSVQAGIVRLLADLQRDRVLSIVFITHNLALVRSVADRVVTLNEGRVVEVGHVEQVIVHPVDSYTRQLIAHTPCLPSDGLARR